MDNISKETYIMPLPEERNYKNDLLKLIPAFFPKYQLLVSIWAKIVPLKPIKNRKTSIFFKK